MSYLVENLTTKAGTEGPQIVLSWDLPSSHFDIFEIYRKLGNYPEFAGDGLLVFSGRTNFFSDRLIRSQKIYYYTVFTKDTLGEYHFDMTTQQKSFSYSTGHAREVLWDILVSSQTLFDSKHESALTETTSPIDGELFNFGEQTIDRGQLWRFVKLLSLEFDLIVELINFLTCHWDVDKTDIDFLPLFSDMLGIDAEFALQPKQRRHRIKNIVNVYKYKGTKLAYVRIAEATVGHSIIVHETSRNVFMVGDVLPDLSDPIVAFLRYTPYDIQKILGGTGWSGSVYGHDKFIVFVDKGESILYKSSIQRLQKAATPQFTPIGTEASYVLWTKRTEYLNKPISQNSTAAV